MLFVVGISLAGLAGAQTPASCPTISVTGPAGITQPGEKFTFAGGVEGDVPKNVSFQWEVMGGKIVEGQGTLKILADAKWHEGGTTITATLNILGLPEGCPKSVSESAGVACMCASVLIDELGRLPNRALRTRLNKFFTELSNHPNNQGYIIVYGTEKEMVSREQFIAKEVMFGNFDRSRITIVRGGRHPEGIVYTRLYRVPPGASNPAP